VSEIRAYVDSDHAFVVWQLDEQIPDCRGFELSRKETATNEETILDSFVGFAGDTAPPGTRRPSTEWPIQRFMWSDYAPPRKEVCYRAVPLVGPKEQLVPDKAQAIGWSDPVTVTPDVGDGISAFFNRGIVATQWLSRELRERGGQTRANLTEAIEKPGDRIRKFLGGGVLWRLPRLLAEAEQSGGEIHAALFELNDEELIDALGAFGPRAHVLLANGTKDEDENADARAKLRAKHVDVRDRLVHTSSHFAHNKFLVVSDDGGTPISVWTGSTNWTITGLCTQSNNAVLIENADVAAWYRDAWDELVKAANAYPDELFKANDVVRTTDLTGAASAQAWFAPVRGTVDLESARQRINEAEQGILFLMFNPGPVGTLLNDIVERTSAASDTYNSDLHIHGVVNQDPSTKKHPVGLLHRGELTEADIDVVLPAAVDEDYAFWLEELNYSMVMVHSKCIVVDPFGAKPAVMTGSHNMGPKASGKNDDNLVIIDGQRRLAEAFAVYIMGVYNQYRWRYYQRLAEKGEIDATLAEADAAPTWAGLVDDDTWQRKYFKKGGPERRELTFWLQS
jgi:phosphatidylserine/phosphatidylglycerophosphate/cardiolipin synthase-like enzyme